MQSQFSEFRCHECHKLLFKGILVDSAVEVKCKRCGSINKFKGGKSSKYMCLVYPCPNRIEVEE